MKKTIAAGLIACATTATAENMQKASPLTVAETTDGLVAAVEGVGATVFARVDHAAGARSVGQDIPDAQLLIFGNPTIGTAAMALDLRAGLVLPLRVLVFEDAEGQTQMLWSDAETLFQGLDIPADAPVIGKINAALDGLTNKAMSAN